MRVVAPGESAIIAALRKIRHAGKQHAVIGSRVAVVELCAVELIAPAAGCIGKDRPLQLIEALIRQRAALIRRERREVSVIKLIPPHPGWRPHQPQGRAHNDAALTETGRHGVEDITDSRARPTSPSYAVAGHDVEREDVIGLHAMARRAAADPADRDRAPDRKVEMKRSGPEASALAPGSPRGRSSMSRRHRPRCGPARPHEPPRARACRPRSRLRPWNGHRSNDLVRAPRPLSPCSPAHRIRPAMSAIEPGRNTARGCRWRMQAEVVGRGIAHVGGTAQLATGRRPVACIGRVGTRHGVGPRRQCAGEAEAGAQQRASGWSHRSLPGPKARNEASRLRAHACDEPQCARSGIDTPGNREN